MSKQHYAKLKKEAHDMYVIEGLFATDISKRINVSAKTLSSWVNENDGAWKKERSARAVSSKKSGENIQQIIDLTAEKKIEVLKRIEEAKLSGNKELEKQLRGEAASLDNSVAQWNKALQDANKGNRISLSVYLDVMDEIFDAIRLAEPDHYFALINFQEAHLIEITKKYG